MITDIARYRYVTRSCDASRRQVKDPSLLRFLVDCRGADASAKQLRDDLITLLIAGHETTGSMLTWATWLLAQYPEAKERMQREIDEVLGDRMPTFEDVKALKEVNHSSARLTNLSMRDMKILVSSIHCSWRPPRLRKPPTARSMYATDSPVPVVRPNPMCTCCASRYRMEETSTTERRRPRPCTARPHRASLHLQNL